MNLKDGSIKREISHDSNIIYFTWLSAGNTVLSVCSTGTCKETNLETSAYNETEFEQTIDDFKFSNCSKLGLLVSSRSVSIVDMSSKDIKYQFDIDNDWTIDFSPCSKFITLSAGNTISVHSIESKKTLYSINSPANVNSSSLSSEGEYLSAVLENKTIFVSPLKIDPDLFNIKNKITEAG